MAPSLHRKAVTYLSIGASLLLGGTLHYPAVVDVWMEGGEDAVEKATPNAFLNAQLDVARHSASFEMDNPSMRSGGGNSGHKGGKGGGAKPWKLRAIHPEDKRCALILSMGHGRLSSPLLSMTERRMGGSRGLCIRLLLSHPKNNRVVVCMVS